MNKSKKLSLITDSFGIPSEDNVLSEMANIRSDRTGLPYSIHIRTKEETIRTSHSKTPTLKVYKERPGKSENFTMIISLPPEVPESHKENEFYKSINKKDFSLIQKWIEINYQLLMEFWNEGSNWFSDEVKDWENKLKSV